MAELEEIMNNTEQTTYLKQLGEIVKKVYNQTFWDEQKGRYIGCIDIDDVKHDYGFTFLNLEAIFYNLCITTDQVKRIYYWLENEPTASGKKDTFTRWIFSPRSLTMYNPPRYEDKTCWWSMVWEGTEYEGQCQSGGTILYTSFYDICNRAKYLGPDNAYQRFTEILNRFSKPDKLSGGSPLFYGEAAQGGPGGGAGSVGVEGEFAENVLAPASFIYAFLGIDADIYGLHIQPRLPQKLSFIGVKNLNYWGANLEIKAKTDYIEIKCNENKNQLDFTLNGEKIDYIENKCFEIYKKISHGQTIILKPSL